MEDAITDAAAIGYPPGKEAIYLEMGHSDDRTFKKWAAAKQPFPFIFQRKIKEHFDPNDVGDGCTTTSGGVRTVNTLK